METQAAYRGGVAHHPSRPHPRGPQDVLWPLPGTWSPPWWLSGVTCLQSRQSQGCSRTPASKPSGTTASPATGGPRLWAGGLAGGVGPRGRQTTGTGEPGQGDSQWWLQVTNHLSGPREVHRPKEPRGEDCGLWLRVTRGRWLFPRDGHSPVRGESRAAGAGGVRGRARVCTPVPSSPQWALGQRAAIGF